MERMFNHIAIITRANRPVLARDGEWDSVTQQAFAGATDDFIPAMEISTSELYIRAFFAVTILLFDNDDCKLIVLLKLHNKLMV